MSKKTLRTLTQYIVNRKDKKKLRRYLLDYAQLENLLIHLLNDTMPGEGACKKDWKVWNLLTNRVLMKAVLKENAGREKTKAQIAELLQHFGTHHFLVKSIQHCKEKKINGHNASMLISRLKKNFSNTFEQIKKYKRGEIEDFPSFPQAKKLRRKYKFSVPFESSKFTCKKDGIYLNFFNKQERFYFPLKGKLKNIDINNVTVGFYHSDVYINLSYQDKVPQAKAQLNTNDRKRKYAGLDIGIKNLFALFIDDESTHSLVYSGKGLIAKNVSWNREIAQIQSQQKATKNQLQLSKLRKNYKQMMAKRRRSFKGQFEQISSAILKYLLKHQVTHLMISKNLSFAKQKGKIKQQKNSKQTFYQIPFGNFLNILQAKCLRASIVVEVVDEAWTSKTSVLSDDVQQSQSRSSTGKTGYRGVMINKQHHRGLYFDKVFKVIYNSDVGAAANHIKVFAQLAVQNLSKYLFKICNPKKIKSTREFNCFIETLNS